MGALLKRQAVAEMTGQTQILSRCSTAHHSTMLGSTASVAMTGLDVHWKLSQSILSQKCAPSLCLLSSIPDMRRVAMSAAKQAASSNRNP